MQEIGMNENKAFSVEVLGTKYDVTYKSEDEIRKDLDRDDYVWGYCDSSTHDIVISNMEEAHFINEKSKKVTEAEVLRHELVHAFLDESGLKTQSWAENEEMVDWIANQFPKMARVMEEIGVL